MGCHFGFISLLFSLSSVGPVASFLDAAAPVGVNPADQRFWLYSHLAGSCRKRSEGLVSELSLELGATGINGVQLPGT